MDGETNKKIENEITSLVRFIKNPCINSNQ